MSSDASSACLSSVSTSAASRMSTWRSWKSGFTTRSAGSRRRSDRSRAPGSLSNFAAGEGRRPSCSAARTRRISKTRRERPALRGSSIIVTSGCGTNGTGSAGSSRNTTPSLRKRCLWETWSTTSKPPAPAGCAPAQSSPVTTTPINLVLTGYNHTDQLVAARPDLIVEHLGELQQLLDQADMDFERARALHQSKRASGMGAGSRPDPSDPA